MIVADASVIVAAFVDDSAGGDRVRSRLRGERLTAPFLVDVEVVSAWRRQSAAGLLDARRAKLALTDLQELPLRRFPHAPLMARCWELRNNMTVYDASYVALAELFEVTLLTTDQRLARSPGLRCNVEVIR